MDINRLKIRKLVLLKEDNPEWMEIITLRKKIQNDFSKYGSLSYTSFRALMEWKFPEQDQKMNKIIESCPEALLKSITSCYLAIEHPDEEMEMRIKLHVLLSIPWIGFGVATSLMAFHEPDKFASIDPEIWMQLYRKPKSTFSIKDYIQFLEDLKPISKEMANDFQEISYLIKQGSYEE